MNKPKEMSTEDLDKLKKVVAALTKEVKKRNSDRANEPTITSTGSPYPLALNTQPAAVVGIVIDISFNIAALVQQNKANPPSNLYWLQITSYKDFEKFLKERGIPAYVSFGGSLNNEKRVQQKDGYDCAKLLVKTCQEAGLKNLPITQCHAGTETKKTQIEMLLLDYHLPAKHTK